MSKRKANLEKRIAALIQQEVDRAVSRVQTLYEIVDPDAVIWLNPYRASKAFAKELYEKRKEFGIYGVSLLKNEGKRYRRVESHGIHIGRKVYVNPSEHLLNLLLHEKKHTTTDYHNPDSDPQDASFEGKTIIGLGSENDYLLTINHRKKDPSVDRVIKHVGQMMSRVVGKGPKYIGHKEGRARAEESLQHPINILRKLIPKKEDIPPLNYLDIDFYIQPLDTMGKDKDAISGDYIHFNSHRNKLGFYIGDVKGHGIKAATHTEFIDTLLRGQHELTPNLRPYEVVDLLNKQYCRKVQRLGQVESFISLLGGRISQNGRFTYSNAGHNPPILLRRKRIIKEGLDQASLILGVDEETEYKDKTIQLKKGDYLIFYTDGVTEAQNRRGDQYGLERLEKAAIRLSGRPVDKMTGGIVDNVRRFYKRNAPSTKFHDDFTVVVMRYNKS